MKDLKLNVYDFLSICVEDYHANREQGAFKDTTATVKYSSKW